MLTLAISCLTMSNFLDWWFLCNTVLDSTGLYLLSPPDTSTTEHRFHCGRAASFSGAISSCPLFFPSSMLDTFGPEGLVFSVLSFCLFILSRCSRGKNTGVGCHFLLPRIFLTQGSNLGLPHCRQTLYRLSHQGSPNYTSLLGLLLTMRATPILLRDSCTQ